MRIRKKISLIVVVVSVLMFITTFFIGFGLLLPSFVALEEQETYKRIEQVNNVLYNELTDLDSTSSDWAYWDDTYFFVQDANDDYIELNQLDSTFITLRLNFMVFIDTSGKVVYSKDFDYSGNLELPPLERVNEDILSRPDLWNLTDYYDEIVGAVNLADEPAIIACKSILTSQLRGPIAGTLIVGRYLDINEATLFSNTTGLPVTISKFSTEVIENELAAKTPFTDELSAIVKPLDEESIAAYAWVKDVNSDPIAVMQVTNSRYIYVQGLSTVNFYIALSHLVWIIFAVLIMVIMEKGIVLPIHKLTTSVKEMTIANNASPTSRFGGDETTLLAEAVKDTLTQRLAAIEELAGMVGHDLRNPLQGITGATYYLKTKCSPNMDETGKEMLKVIEEDVAYSNKIINDLLDYSRAVHLDLFETNPKALIDKVLSFVKIPQNITLINTTENTPTFRADMTKLQRVFLNVINNAIDAMPQGGTLTIMSKDSKSSISLILADTGIGMPKAVMDRIWTPLFTTKAKGMGFGLSISKRMVEAHGGSITLESTAGKGTKITVKLPLNPKKQ